MAGTLPLLWSRSPRGTMAVGPAQGCSLRPGKAASSALTACDSSSGLGCPTQGWSQGLGWQAWLSSLASPGPPEARGPLGPQLALAGGVWKTGTLLSLLSFAAMDSGGMTGNLEICFLCLDSGLLGEKACGFAPSRGAAPHTSCWPGCSWPGECLQEKPRTGLPVLPCRVSTHPTPQGTQQCPFHCSLVLWVSRSPRTMIPQPKAPMPGVYHAGRKPKSHGGAQ